MWNDSASALYDVTRQSEHETLGSRQSVRTYACLSTRLHVRIDDVILKQYTYMYMYYSAIRGLQYMRVMDSESRKYDGEGDNGDGNKR